MKKLFEHIVVAVSGSDASISAAKYGIVLSRQYDCSLTGVYVVDVATIRQLAMQRIFIPEESAEYERSLVENGKRYLGYVAELAAAKKVPVNLETRTGAIFTEILAVADSNNADLILLGGWEPQRSSRDIIAEAHREVLFNSTCSVLVVKEPNIDRYYRAL